MGDLGTRLVGTPVKYPAKTCFKQYPFFVILPLSWDLFIGTVVWFKAMCQPWLVIFTLFVSAIWQGVFILAFDGSRETETCSAPNYNQPCKAPYPKLRRLNGAQVRWNISFKDFNLPQYSLLLNVLFVLIISPFFLSLKFSVQLKILINLSMQSLCKLIVSLNSSVAMWIWGMKALNNQLYDKPLNNFKK